MAQPLFDPYTSGNKKPTEGPYGLTRLLAEVIPQTASTHLGSQTCLGSAGAASAMSGAGGLLPSLVNRLVTCRPGESRSALVKGVDESAREDATPQIRSRDTRLTGIQHELLSSSVGKTSYPMVSVDRTRRHPDTDSGSSSLDWLSDYKKFTADNSSKLHSSSLSSCENRTGSWLNSSSEKGRDMISQPCIPGLGDYENPVSGRPETPPQPRQDKYNLASDADILSRFGLDADDLEHLLSYPEEQLTHTNLPTILHQIHLQKTKSAASLVQSKADTVHSASSGRTAGARMQQHEASSAVHQQQKPIPCGLGGRHSGGFEAASGQKKAVGKPVGANVLVTDNYSSSNRTREPLPENTSAVKSGGLGSFQDHRNSVPSLSSSYRSVSRFASSTMQDPKKLSRTQINQTLQLMDSIGFPEKDTKDTVDKSLRHLQADHQPTLKTRPATVDSTQSGFMVFESKDDRDKIQGQNSTDCKQGKDEMQQKKPVSLTPTEQTTSADTRVPGAAGVSGGVPRAGFIPWTLAIRNVLLQPPRTKPNASTTTPSSTSQSPEQVSVSEGLPALAMMCDCAGTVPKHFPHTCSLCNTGSTQLKDWLAHKDTSLHLKSCDRLQKRYPDWVGAKVQLSSTPLSSALPKEAKPSCSVYPLTSWQPDQKTTRETSSSSRSPSPENSRGSRSRSRSSSSTNYSCRSRTRSHSPLQDSSSCCLSSSSSQERRYQKRRRTDRSPRSRSRSSRSPRSRSRTSRSPRSRSRTSRSPRSRSRTSRSPRNRSRSSRSPRNRSRSSRSPRNRSRSSRSPRSRSRSSRSPRSRSRSSRSPRSRSRSSRSLNSITHERKGDKRQRRSTEQSYKRWSPECRSQAGLEYKIFSSQRRSTQRWSHERRPQRTISQDRSQEKPSPQRWSHERRSQRTISQDSSQERPSPQRWSHERRSQRTINQDSSQEKPSPQRWSHERRPQRTISQDRSQEKPSPQRWSHERRSQRTISQDSSQERPSPQRWSHERRSRRTISQDSSQERPSPQRWSHERRSQRTISQDSSQEKPSPQRWSHERRSPQRSLDRLSLKREDDGRCSPETTNEESRTSGSQSPRTRRHEHQSLKRSPERRSPSRKSHKKHSLQKTHHETKGPKKQSPQRSKPDKQPSTGSSAAKRNKLSAAEKLAKKLLKPALKTLSQQPDLNALVETVTPALMSQLIKMTLSSTSSSSLVPAKRTRTSSSSSSKAEKKKKGSTVSSTQLKPGSRSSETSSSSKTKDAQSSRSAPVKLRCVPASLTHEDLVTAVEHFGKSRSVLLFHSKQEAHVYFETKADAQKLKRIKILTIKGYQIPVSKKASVSEAQKNDPVSSHSKREATKTKSTSNTTAASGPVKPKPSGNAGAKRQEKAGKSPVKCPKSLITTKGLVCKAKNVLMKKAKIQTEPLVLRTDEEVSASPVDSTSTASDNPPDVGGPAPESRVHKPQRRVAAPSPVEAAAGARLTDGGAAPQTDSVATKESETDAAAVKTTSTVGADSAAAPKQSEAESATRSSADSPAAQDKLYTGRIHREIPILTKEMVVPADQCLNYSTQMVLIKGLPAYSEGRYTEGDLASLLTPFGFVHKPDTLYVIPQAQLAFAWLQSWRDVSKAVEVCSETPLVLDECELSVHAVSRSFSNEPLWFYQSLMWLMNARVHGDGTRTIFVVNISESELKHLRQALRKIGDVVHFLPLLNKAFIEFKTPFDADRLGVWYSLLYKVPGYELKRLRNSFVIRKLPRPKRPEKALPNLKEIAAGATVPRLKISIPMGTAPPFWIPLRNHPFLFPTVAPWFKIPAHLTVYQLVDINGKRRFCVTPDTSRDYFLGHVQPARTPITEVNTAGGHCVCTIPMTAVSRHSRIPTIMITGLPSSNYKHQDVAKLVWPYFPHQNLHALYYNVTVFMLQRRAFIHFTDWHQCCSFVRSRCEHPTYIGGCQLAFHFVLEWINAASSEEDMYISVMEWSNTLITEPETLQERLLSVEICDTSLDAVRVVMEVVTSIAPVVGFLPLGNRICIEMASAGGVTKVLETYSSYSPSVYEDCVTWATNVGRFESVVQLKRRLQDATDVIINLDACKVVLEALPPSVQFRPLHKTEELVLLRELLSFEKKQQRQETEKKQRQEGENEEVFPLMKAELPGSHIPTITTASGAVRHPKLASAGCQNLALPSAALKPVPGPVNIGETSPPSNGRRQAAVALTRRLPVLALMYDYAAVTPRNFPHTCSLCNTYCATMTDWLVHQNTNFHLQSCKCLRERYPDWDGGIKLPPSHADNEDHALCSSVTSKQRYQKSRSGSRSRSGSPSPRRTRSHHSPSSNSETHSSPERSSSQKKRPRSVVTLAKKLLKTSAAQSLSPNSNVEIVAQTLAPALLAEVAKWNSSSSSSSLPARRQCSSAEKKKLTTISSKAKSGLKKVGKEKVKAKASPAE